MSECDHIVGLADPQFEQSGGLYLATMSQFKSCEVWYLREEFKFCPECGAKLESIVHNFGTAYNKVKDELDGEIKSAEELVLRTTR